MGWRGIGSYAIGGGRFCLLMPGFCKSASLGEVRGHGYVLTPGRYVGAANAEEDDVPFEERMAELTQKLKGQFEESVRLEAAIRQNLEGLGYEW